MKYPAAVRSGLLGLLFALAAAAHAQTARAEAWTEGRHFEVISPAQRTTVPAGKVEVMEVFSYGCIACNAFQPAIAALERSLPANAQMVFLPASFNPAEDWPMLQRAYFTAQALGVASRTHQGMFDAVWKTGELGISDPATRRLKNPQPSIEAAAKCYEHLAGIRPEVFLATARSFAVDLKMHAADAQIEAMHVPSTPCIVVNGKYRIVMDSLQSQDDLNGLVRYLVDRESRH
ncbi:MAG TPA: thiol:disulfide interchange protein DsbA/DsbL [Steroidobacteraceae bacterium]|nr:thiol:disulfide interchange protein DsbA/DsbL [Steroidobacteraceae bacterium]